MSHDDSDESHRLLLMTSLELMTSFVSVETKLESNLDSNHTLYMTHNRMTHKPYDSYTCISNK